MTQKERLTISVPEAAELSGIGRDRLYQLCRTKGFPCIWFSEHSVRIHKEQFVEWVAKQTSCQFVCLPEQN